MDSGEAYIATARDPALDWQEPGATLKDFHLLVRYGWGMTSVFQVASALATGKFPGRQLDWGAHIACVTKAQARRFLEDHHWPVPSEFDALAEDDPYFLVAIES